MYVAADFGEVFVPIEMDETGLHHDRTAAFGQAVEKRRRTERAVFDAVAMIGPRQTALGMLNRVDRGAHRRLFDRVDGDLQPATVDLPDHLGQCVRWRVKMSTAFMQHDFYTADANPVGRSYSSLPFGLSQFREAGHAQHHGRSGMQDVFLHQVGELSDGLKGVVGARVVKRADAMAQ